MAQDVHVMPVVIAPDGIYSILTYGARSVVARDLRARGSVMFAITSEVAITSRARRPEVDGYRAA